MSVGTKTESMTWECIKIGVANRVANRVATLWSTQKGEEGVGSEGENKSS